MPKTAAPDWAAIRYRYEETDAAVAAIAAEAGISKSELESARKRHGWLRNKPRGLAPGRRPAPPSGTVSRPSGTVSDLAAGSADQADASRKSVTVPAPLAEPETVRKPAKPKPKRPAASGTGHRRRLLDRLVAAISLKLEQLERRMSHDLAKDLDPLEQGDAATSTDHERETRAIGALIDNLGKVTEMETGLDRSAKSGKSNPAAADIAGEADRYRRELAERLAKIVGAATARS